MKKPKTQSALARELGCHRQALNRMILRLGVKRGTEHAVFYYTKFKPMREGK